MKQEVLELLGWDELEYGQFIYDTGLEYLPAYIPGNAAAIAALERSRIFWAWWKNHWRQRDEEFLAKVNRCESPEAIRFYYGWKHNPKRLATKFTPNSVVLDDSYAEMIGQFNDEIIKQ